MFPPVNSYYRLLIHKQVERLQPDLHSFSIGVEEGRRTVVCHPQQLLVRSVEATVYIKDDPVKAIVAYAVSITVDNREQQFANEETTPLRACQKSGLNRRQFKRLKTHMDMER